MSVLKTSWRCSLAATALWALVGPSSGTAADNPPSPPEKPAVERPAPPPGPERREGTRRDDSRGPSDEVQKQRQRLMDEVRALHTKAEGLKDGSDADRKELRAKMQKLYEQLQALPGGPRPGGERRPEGREGGPRPDAAGRPEGRGDLERQVQHLRAAAENLRAAGMMEEADMVLRKMQRLVAAASQGGPSREAGPPREGTRSGRDMPGGPPREGMGPGRGEGPPPAFRGEIAELRGQVQQIRQEMQELREQIRRFMDKQSGDRRPERTPPPSPGESGRR